jgi:hypothetical protein
MENWELFDYMPGCIHVGDDWSLDVCEFCILLDTCEIDFNISLLEATEYE